jgi:hypothetical protein
MKLHILQVPNCPNVAVLRARLAEALADTIPDAQVTFEVIESVDEAAAAGMTGSPTLLVDGTDPFGEPSGATSMSCRLYRDDDGGLSGAPSVVALRRVLLGHGG